MKKVRDGIAGEVTAEIFETWFPNKPEIILLDFLKTDSPKMICAIRLSEEEYGICHITQEYAHKLLDEFKIIRKKL